MRTFIAIDLEPGLKTVLQDLIRKLQRTGADVRWTRAEGLHLTLKFLGEVPDNRVAQVCNVVKEVAARHPAFDFNVKEVGTFGGRSARVLWVGAGLQSPDLLKLQEDLEEQLEQAGWPKEGRQFSGHLTLCRIRNAKAGEKLAKLAEQYTEYDLATIRADSVCVYESQLRPEGPIYTRLGNYKLQ